MSELLEKLLNSILTGATISPNSLKFNADETVLNRIITSMWDYISAIAITLSIVYFVLEINRKMMFERDDFTLKSIGAPLFKLIIAYALITNGVTIINGVLSGHDALVEEAAKWGTMEDPKALSSNPFKDFGLIQQLAIFIPMILAWVVSLVTVFLFWYKSLGYKIEFLFRIGVTPIALADVYSGNNSNAIRWLKGFLGLALYGIAFIVLPRIAYALADSMMASFMQSGGISEEARNKMKESGASEADIIAVLVKDSIWLVVKYIVMKMLAPIAALGALSSVRQLTREVTS